MRRGVHHCILHVVACLLAATAAMGGDDLTTALAGVVDATDHPRDAATLEGVPYRMLLERVAVGPDERTLVNLSGLFTYGALRNAPEAHRGAVVFATGIVAQIGRTAAPGVGRTDRNEVHAGLLAVFRRGRIRLWAFRAVRRPGDAVLYVGDRVHLSGYFLKNVPMTDTAGDQHWMPLVVAPWPTYYGKWMPAAMVHQQARGLLPLRTLEPRRVLRRPVIDFHDDGRVALNGIVVDRRDALSAVGRFTARNPGAAIVARARGDAAAARGRRALASLDPPVTCAWKALAPAEPPGLTDARR